MVHSANNLSLLDLSDLPDADRYYVAFSGGKDSTALIHSLSQISLLKPKLTAIHVNHNIDPNAQQWATQCADFCHQINIPIITESVHLSDHSENSCREARHQVFDKYLTNDDCLITGHHQMDQVETMLFRLLRGTGLHGLTGMKKYSQHHAYAIFRPMLNTPASLIKNYNQQQNLNYVDDPSNLNNHYSRNFIRNKLIPMLQSQNPNVLNNLELSRSNLVDTSHLLNTLIGKHNPLDITAYQNPEILKSALYHWINIFDKPSPNRQQLNQFAHDCLSAAKDKNPQMSFTSGDLILWKQHIYWLLPGILNKSIPSVEFNLNANMPYILPCNNGFIKIESALEFEFICVVKYQLLGQTIKLSHQKHSQKLKKLFQDKQIPPWERKLTPYLFIDGNLMAVGNHFIADEFNELLITYNAEYQWLSPRFLL
jgi:tRNA(Ile)-lysidine synthase